MPKGECQWLKYMDLFILSINFPDDSTAHLVWERIEKQIGVRPAIAGLQLLRHCLLTLSLEENQVFGYFKVIQS